MKALGIFRGFPGLGRVVSGVSILEALRDTYGFKVRAVSYLQGNEYLKTKGFELLNEATSFDYCSIGLLPTNQLAKDIYILIKEFCPDIIIIDGEPLMIQSLRISYPNIKLVTLLNPSDVENEANDKEAMDYFNASFQMADLAIIHGNRKVKTKRNYKHVISIPTIIRREVIELKRKPSNTIYCILGGGTLNVSSLFYDSTIRIGSLCIEAAAILKQYRFVILCSCDSIYDALLRHNKTDNVYLEKKIIAVSEYYTDAAMIITRSGRNTLGEVAYLGIPTISFVSGCIYRRAEQLKNIESISSDNIRCADSNISVEDFSSLIVKSISENKYSSEVTDGSPIAIDAILSLYRDNNGLKYYNYEEWKNDLGKAENLENPLLRKLAFKKLRSTIFKENIKIVSECGYSNYDGQWVSITQEGSFSELFHSELSPINNIRSMSTIISVVNEDSIDVGIKLIDQGYNPIVLDMACAEGPGGGVIGGCYGQEESLFRRSDLYYHTFKFTKYATVFGVQKSYDQYPLENNYGAVYVRNANIFRHSESMGYKLMDKCSKLSFVAVPAIKDPVLIYNKLSETDTKITMNKIRTIFRIALQNNHNAIVLGAFGCGIFHNPPKDIAKCFDIVINEKEFKNAFEKIVFAILEDCCSNNKHNISGNFLPFKKQFDQ